MTLSRRAFAACLASAIQGRSAEKLATIPSEAVKYADPATELPVLRLTDPAHTSLLPGHTRAVSRKSNFLLYSNDRTGAFQPYRMDLKSGQSKMLAEVKDLDTSSLTLFPDERSCGLIAGGSLFQLNLANGKQREVYSAADGFSFERGLSLSEDGQFAVVVEQKSGRWRLRLIQVGRGSATTVVESGEEIGAPVVRPKRAGLLYLAAGRELHVIGFDGTQNQRLKVGAGGLGPALWSEDGRDVDYLSFPEERGKLNSIREYTPDTNSDKLVAPTTQYVAFNRNADSSVYVGASGSKASPYVLLLVRAVKRELTLCEHKASDPRLVAPVFAPNSQRVFFQTDRHGKLAVYSMAIERLVEETE